GTSASAREILEVAGQQVTTMFAADPVRGGAVMHALAELYLYLGDYEAAAPLLRRVAEAPETEPSVRASARYDLAQYNLRTADPGAAAVLLAQAQAFWEQDANLWRRRLVDSRLVEARVLRDQGEIDAAIQLLSASLPERIRLSGANHRETGVYHNDLGVLFNAAGRRDEAAASFRAALDIWRETSLGDSPDALNTLNNLAAIEVLSGRPAEAAVLFSRAVEVRRSLYGPSAATAALLNNYGKTLLKLDRGPEALPYLREAVDMAREHAGVGSLHYASAVAGLSEALSVVGDPSAALTTATQGYEAVSGSVGLAHPATAITAIALARVLVRDDRSRAAALLDQAETTLAPMG
ncbi:MAG: tetratricopeptide repeat protein, partial [Brevundimonas sp.]